MADGRAGDNQNLGHFCRFCDLAQLLFMVGYFGSKMTPKMTIVIPIRICIKKIKEWNNFFSNFKKFCRSLYFFLHILISFKSIVLRHFETKKIICAFSIESLPYRNSNRISPNKQRMTSMDFIKSGVCLRLGPKKTFGNEHKDPNHLPMPRINFLGKIF